MIDRPEGGTVSDTWDADGEGEDWRGIAAPGSGDEGALYLALDGWEGPLDLLL